MYGPGNVKKNLAAALGMYTLSQKFRSHAEIVSHGTYTQKCINEAPKINLMSDFMKEN